MDTNPGMGIGISEISDPVQGSSAKPIKISIYGF
jgi:hypothetical protein